MGRDQKALTGWILLLAGGGSCRSDGSSNSLGVLSGLSCCAGSLGVDGVAIMGPWELPLCCRVALALLASILDIGLSAESSVVLSGNGAGFALIAVSGRAEAVLKIRPLAGELIVFGPVALVLKAKGSSVLPACIPSTAVMDVPGFMPEAGAPEVPVAPVVGEVGTTEASQMSCAVAS